MTDPDPVTGPPHDLPPDDAAAGDGAPPRLLDMVAAEIEAHVATGGWDQSPALFALVPTRMIAAEPEGLEMLGLDAEAVIAEESLTPVAQDALPDGALDESLAGIEWPDTVSGCALTQEIVILPPDAEAELDERSRNAGDDAAAQAEVVTAAANHPDRREARLAVAVLRDGQSASVLRLRAADGTQADEIAFGAELAPNLAAALLATLG